MISILECNSNIAKIAERHTDFIVNSLTPVIDFYSEVYNIKSQLTPNSRHSIINKKIKDITTLHGRTRIGLLSKLFTNKRNIKNLNDSWKIKRGNLLLADARDIDEIIISLNFLSNHLREILSLNLNEIYTINSISYDQYRNQLAPINFLLKAIFNYDWFISLDLDKEWNSYKLTDALGIKVCPYCNRQRTFTVQKSGNKITKPELDHFLPKNEHPILALNFYNLIPSCSVCNRDLKSDKSFSYETHLSPYEHNKKHHLMKFDYLPLSYDGAAGITDEIEISVTPKDGLRPEEKRKVEGNISVFKYNDIASNLSDVVQEIVYKRYISDDNYIQILKKTFPNAHLTDSEAYKIAYGNYYDEKDFSKRPLAKMTKDIAYHIGALKDFE